MNFVQLRSFDNYINANIQLGMLQEEGINCYLKDEYIITIDPLLSPAIGGMKLMVYETQAQRAMKLLEEVENKPWLKLKWCNPGWSFEMGFIDWCHGKNSRIFRTYWFFAAHADSCRRYFIFLDHRELPSLISLPL